MKTSTEAIDRFMDAIEAYVDRRIEDELERRSADPGVRISLGNSNATPEDDLRYAVKELFEDLS